MITASRVSGYQVRVTVSWLPEGVSTMTISRVEGSRILPVIAAVDVPAVAGVWDDPEAPLASDGYYYQVAYDSGVEEYSALVSVPADRPILSDPYRGLTVPVILTELGERTSATRATAVDVEGRADPIVLWDVESSPRYQTVQWLTTTTGDAALVDQMSSTGDPLLLRTTCPDVPDMWVQRLGARTRRPFTQRSRAMLHTWSDCLVLPGPWQPDVRPVRDTLGDLHAAVTVKTLGGIAAQWSRNLLDIAADDLKALA